jgi:hypothetical protein
MVTQIRLASKSGMIAVSMCYDGFINRFPGVNIEITRWAEQSFIREFDQRHEEKALDIKIFQQLAFGCLASRAVAVAIAQASESAAAEKAS